MLQNFLVTVTRPTYGQGSNLGITTSGTTAYSNVPATIQPATSSVQQFYAERKLSVTHTVFTTQQLALKVGDQITTPLNTNTYQVQGWRDLSGLGKVLAIDTVVYLK